LGTDKLVIDVFCNELARTLSGTTHADFWPSYDNRFLGCRQRHVDANRKLALFRIVATAYECIAEDRWSLLDIEIHEHPILAGCVGEI